MRILELVATNRGWADGDSHKDTTAPLFSRAAAAASSLVLALLFFRSFLMMLLERFSLSLCLCRLLSRDPEEIGGAAEGRIIRLNIIIIRLYVHGDLHKVENRF